MTVGAYFRSFLVPDVTTIMYVTLPDPLPILELICGLYITRIDTYKWGRGDVWDVGAICATSPRSAG